ncbi:MAG: type II secretion system protein GspC [Gammaproteobacteria bacterium]|nr:type II secretion system protein GspC [Gammaproteobacteria bacterium]
MNAASWLEQLPAHERWRALLLTEGPRIATWALALALGVQAALIVTDIAGNGGKAPLIPVRSAAAPVHRLDLAALTNAHLFGAAPAAKADDANASPTQIPLVLTGIIAGSEPQNGLAILGQTAQSTRVYAVGDNVPGGAKLHAVYSDRVIMDRNGQLESLALPHQSNPSAPAPSATMLQNENPPLERMRRMISEQPGLIGDVMRPQPVMDKGKLNGFRVYPGRDRATFMRLGLRPGDQVIAINGTPLDDPNRGQQILHTLSSSSEAHVTVIRAGQQQDLVLNIAQVAQEADSLAAQAAAQAAANATGAAGAAEAAAPPPQEPPGGDNAGQ